MATYVVYAGAADGQLRSSNATYSTARTGSSLTADTTSTVGTAGQNLSGGTYTIWESFLAFADPALATEEAVSATLSFVVNADSSTTDFTLNIVRQAWLSTLTSADWRYTAAATTYGTASTSGIAVGSYTDVTLTTDIFASGSAQMLLYSSRTVGNNAPSGAEYITIRMADYAGTTSDPKVTYVVQDRPWRLIVGGQRVGTLTDITRLTITDSGPGNVGRLRARIANPGGTVTVGANYDVTLLDTTGALYWVGATTSRALVPAYGSQNDYEIEAVDLSAWLDRAYIPFETIPDGSSDRAAVQQLVATYGTAANLQAPDETVQDTRDALYDLYVENLSLREALQLVADSTLSVDPSGVEWGVRTTPVSQYYTGIEYNGVDQWVAVAFDGGTVITSPDSFGWSTAATAVYAASLDYGNGLYVAGGGDYTVGAGSVAKIYWSSNGTTWSSASLGTAYGETYATTITNDAPTGYYRLGETSGFIATRTSGAYNGVYVNAPTLGTAGALTDDTNTAVYFSGSAYMTVPNLEVGTAAYSLEAWVKAGTAQTSKGLFGRWSSTGGGAMLWLDGSGYYSLAHTTSSANYLTSSSTATTGTWEHIVGTWDGATMRLYRNGTQLTSKAMTTNPSTAGTYEFAAARYMDTGYFTGALDEVAVYDTALSSATIVAHYAAGTAAYHGSPTWSASAYGTAGWVTVGADYTRGYVAKSTSGTASWAITNVYSGTAMSGITYVGGTYVAVGANVIQTSVNGTAWTAAPTSPTLGSALLGVATNGTAVVAVGPAGNIYYAATAAGTFTKQTAPAVERLEAVTWWPNGGLWVAVGGADTTFTSPDGTTWTQQTSAEFGLLTDVAPGGNRIVAAGAYTIIGSQVQDTRQRQFYVDVDNQVNYGILSDAAPYAISDAPDGTTSVAAEQLEIDYDESRIVNRVYVATAPSDPVYAAWVEDTDSVTTYFAREALLVNELADTAARAERYGRAYLANTKDPIVRGTFAVTGYDGWRAGQTVTITNAALGLSGATYLITQVETEFLDGTGTRRYQVSFGGLPKSLVATLASGS